MISAEDLLFDCDGVLVDSDETAAQAWNSWAAEYAPGFDFVRDITHGGPAGDTVAELVPARDLDRAKRARIQCEIDTAPMVRALPGAVELLSLIPQDSWTVVTSAVLAVAPARLGAAGLPCPDDIVTAHDVGRGKPAPDPYRIGAHPSSSRSDAATGHPRAATQGQEVDLTDQASTVAKAPTLCKEARARR